MRWRPPRSVNILGHLITVDEVSAEELRDLLADADDERLGVGGWLSDQNRIVLLRTLSAVEKNRTYWHEVHHALVDLFDP